MNKIILDFERQTLDEALRGVSTTALIALADISTITEFCPISERLPAGLSLITLKKGRLIPVKGTPDTIKKKIDLATE